MHLILLSCVLVSLIEYPSSSHVCLILLSCAFVPPTTISIFSLTSNLIIKDTSIQRIQISLISAFVIIEYKAQSCTYDCAVLNLKIKSRRDDDSRHQKYCSLYVQLSRLRSLRELHLLESIFMNDIKYESHDDFKRETERLVFLQKKILTN